MKFDLTRQNFAQSMIISILLLIFFGGKMLFLQEDISAISTLRLNLGPLGNIFINFIEERQILSLILLLIALFVNSFHLYRVLVIGGANTKSSNIVSSIFIAISATIPSITASLIAQILLIAMLMSMEHIFRIKKTVNCSSQYFMGAFYISVATLFVPSFIFFIFPIITVNIVAKRFKIKEFISSFFGLLLPLFLYSYSTWIIERNPLSLIPYFEKSFEQIGQYSNLGLIVPIPYLIIATISTGGILVLALFNFARQPIEMRTKSYRTYLFFVYWMVWVILFMGFFTAPLILLLPTLFITVAIFISFFLQKMEDRVLSSAIYLIFILIFITLIFII